MKRRSILKLGGYSLTGIALSGVTSSCEQNHQGEGKPLQGQVALVTGGARGIGSTVAIHLAKKGAKIAICDIPNSIKRVPYSLATEDELHKTKASIEELDAECMVFQSDTRDRKAMQDMAEEIRSIWQQIDILVANAGINNWSGFDETSDDGWEEVIKVNLTGTANTINAVLPVMKQNEYGRIVCVSAQQGRTGSPEASVYSASKWAILGLTKSTALEAGQYNIRCNAICPAFTNTTMLNNDRALQKLSPDDPTLKGLNEQFQSRSIPDQLLQPEEVADSVASLCLPAAGHISATITDVASHEAAKHSK